MRDCRKIIAPLNGLFAIPEFKLMLTHYAVYSIDAFKIIDIALRLVNMSFKNSHVFTDAAREIHFLDYISLQVLDTRIFSSEEIMEIAREIYYYIDRLYNGFILLLRPVIQQHWEGKVTCEAFLGDSVVLAFRPHRLSI